MKWLIKQRMAEKHIESFTELADKVGMTRRRFYDRLRNPETFKVYELRMLADVLGLTNEDLIVLIWGDDEKSN